MSFYKSTYNYRRNVAITIVVVLLCSSLSQADVYAANKPYTVEKGDNLWNLADATYGQGMYYHEIFEANKDIIGDDEDLIFPGMVFYLPTITAEGGGSGVKGSGSTQGSGSTKSENAAQDTRIEKITSAATASGTKLGGFLSKSDNTETDNKKEISGTTNSNGVKSKGTVNKDANTESSTPKTKEGSISSVNKETGSNGTATTSSMTTITRTYTEDEEDTISDFFIAYYTALADGDADYCKSVYDGISKDDKEMVESLAAYIDRFENMRCRAMAGPADGSYVAFVDYGAESTKDGLHYDLMDVFYLYSDDKQIFMIEKPETYFKDAGLRK